MYASLLTLVAIPALALAQATITTSASAVLIPTTGVVPGSAARASCATGDAFCINTANGWNSAAARYLADERSTDSVWPVIASELVGANQKVGSTGSLASEAAKATNGPQGFAFIQSHATLIGESGRAPVTSVLGKALSLQTAGVAQATGAAGSAGRNGTSPSPTGGVGAAGASPSNIAQTNAAARPVDVAFMAMGAAVAGIAGIAYGL